jgi:hypothetical protein
MADTPSRPIRIADELWKPSLAKAKDEGTNVSEKIRHWLRQDLGWTTQEDTMKDRDELPVEGRPRSHLAEEPSHMGR